MTNTTSSAAARVFGIVELLENILSSVDVFDLFVVQRVNSTFHAVIANSTSFREVMHLEPQEAAKDIDIVSRLKFLQSTKVKKAISPFEVATFAKPHNTPSHRLRVTIPDKYRCMETMVGHKRLELLRLSDASWKNIQIGTSLQRLELCIAGGGRWGTRSKLTVEFGADLGCVVKALCEFVTEHWQAQQYLEGMGPWSRLVAVAETGGTRRGGTLMDLSCLSGLR